MPRVVALCLLLTATILAARADVIVTDDGATYRGKIVKETRSHLTIQTKVGKVRVPRASVSKIVRTAELRKTFHEKLARATKSKDPDKLFQVGKWAKRENLRSEARQAWAEAIKLDAYHEKARRALKHRKHQGRWYSPNDYKRDVLKLVRHKGSWVTPLDKERLEAGLVKNAKGEWGLPPGATERAPRRPKPVAAKPKPRPSAAPPRPKPGSPAKPRVVRAEDMAWYRDNHSTGSFANAAVTESRHYRIKSNVRPEYAKRYGKMMDRYYKRFLKVFKEFLPRGEIKKSDIWIYASRAEFRRAEGMGPSTGGFYFTGNKRVTAFHGPFGNTGGTREVLAHEGTHQFQDICLGGRFGNAPTWILEGLAVLFESAVYDGKEVVIGLVPRDRLQVLKRGLASGTLIPLTRLIRTPQSSFQAYHYAHAWGLIYMVLYYSDNAKIRKRTQKWFSDLFAAAKKGRVTAALVEERCGGREKFLELEQKWKEWIRDLPYDFDPRSR
jgi:hypothetical protein